MPCSDNHQLQLLIDSKEHEFWDWSERSTAMSTNVVRSKPPEEVYWIWATIKLKPMWRWSRPTLFLWRDKLFGFMQTDSTSILIRLTYRLCCMSSKDLSKIFAIHWRARMSMRWKQYTVSSPSEIWGTDECVGIYRFQSSRKNALCARLVKTLHQKANAHGETWELSV